MDTITAADLITLAANYPSLDEAVAAIWFDPRHYHRRTLSRTDKLEVVLVCFTGHQSTSLHDHGGSECVVRCLRGMAHETVYKRDCTDDGIYVVRSGPIVEGDIVSVAPDELHQITNMKGGGTVFLNFYSPPLPPLGRVDEDRVWADKSAETLFGWASDN